MPLLDFFGPYAFFPKHCYPDENQLQRYNSPVIAVIRTGASMEEDVVEQLRSLFRFQK